MVGTRRSQKTAPVEATVDTPRKSPRSSSTQEPKVSTSVSASKRRSRGKQKQEELQTKNTGLGLSIDISETSEKKKNKIVFDEDEVITFEDPAQGQQAVDEKKGSKEEAPIEDDDDDVDDVVEEVKGSSAREEILHQLEAEEKGAVKAKKQKKRKERKTINDVKDEGDDFDDDFFAQLETVKEAAAAEEEEEKKKLASKQKKGKHTTFSFDDIDQASPALSQPKKVGHNIQVVVLPEPEEMEIDDALTALPTTALSTDALVYSRSFLPDGSDKGGKRKRKSPILPDTSWKRSRKMNLILSAKVRSNGRSRQRGRPASIFVTKAMK